LVASRKSGVGGKALEVARHHILYSLASAHQCYQHEDAPEDSKGGQETPGFVSGDGDENFFPSVYVNSK